MWPSSRGIMYRDLCSVLEFGIKHNMSLGGGQSILKSEHDNPLRIMKAFHSSVTIPVK